MALSESQRAARVVGGLVRQGVAPEKIAEARAGPSRPTRRWRGS